MSKKILKLLFFIAAFCIDPFTMALLAAVASAAVSAKNASDTSKRKRTAINQMLANQEGFGRDAQKKITQTIEDFQPGEEKEDLAFRDAENTAILERLATANRSERENRPEVSGKLSSAFQGESLRRRAGTDAKAQARQLSLARFFGSRQRPLDTGAKLSSLQNTLGTVRSFQAGQTRADQNKINSILPNGGMELLSGILKGVSLFAGGGGFGATGAVTPATGAVSGLSPAPTAGILARTPNFALGS